MREIGGVMNFIIKEAEDHVDEHAHGTFSIDSLIDVVFGIEHVIAEFFWNAIFILATFAFTRALALRKIHKYVDDKHGVAHEKGGY